MRHAPIIQALIAPGIIAWLLTGVAGSAAVFDENLPNGAGAPVAATTADGLAGAAVPTASHVANVTDSSNSSKSGFVLQGHNGSVFPLASGAAWSRQDLTGDGLNSFGTGHEGRPVGASLSDRILSSVDSPLVVRAKGLGSVAREPQPNPVRVSGILPKLAAGVFCAWFGFYFLRCLRPYNGLRQHRTPRGFFKAGR